jgi:hypothetical protein
MEGFTGLLIIRLLPLFPSGNGCPKRSLQRDITISEIMTASTAKHRTVIEHVLSRRPIAS